MQAVGTPILMDNATVNLTRPSTARICVEVDLLKELPNRIWIEQGKGFGGEGFWQKIIPDRLPLYCSQCYRQGHGIETCRSMLTKSLESKDKTTNEPLKEGKKYAGKDRIPEDQQAVKPTQVWREKNSSAVTGPEEGESGKLVPVVPQGILVPLSSNMEGQIFLPEGDRSGSVTASDEVPVVAVDTVGLESGNSQEGKESTGVQTDLPVEVVNLNTDYLDGAVVVNNVVVEVGNGDPQEGKQMVFIGTGDITNSTEFSEEAVTSDQKGTNTEMTNLVDFNLQEGDVVNVVSVPVISSDKELRIQQHIDRPSGAELHKLQSIVEDITRQLGE